MKGIHSTASTAGSLPFGLQSHGSWQEKRLFCASYTLHNRRSAGQHALGHVNWGFSCRMGHKYISDMFISWQRQRMTHKCAAENGIWASYLYLPWGHKVASPLRWTSKVISWVVGKNPSSFSGDDTWRAVWNQVNLLCLCFCFWQTNRCKHADTRDD